MYRRFPLPCALLLAALACHSAGAAQPEVPPFSGLTTLAGSGWETLEFPNIHQTTDYRLVTDGGTQVVQAQSRGGASGLIFRLQQPVSEDLTLRWRWKIAGIHADGDARHKDGDDYAARIYVAFAFEPERSGWLARMRHRAAELLFGEALPGRALNYIWANRLPRGTRIANAYTDRTVMIAVESGPEAAGQWRMERRNLARDYREAFGETPPAIVGIAIMSDADNTGEQATAWYGDLVLTADQ
ncbi:DUF3047 domain-containing protein [Marinobacter lutaoensis]|uniref:DUF3047 domain-containing protein n=1 Tax=Marinobacter lutaoensis TaxID=135739 RepID=UPI001592F8DF|nr:DUF3047 domain-containing protein [Marinobacter lutaoensis]NVD36316.1 DUF3047 domain-containing protein [Marinobacter lutaoensis]